jgi:hypothetical protein
MDAVRQFDILEIYNTKVEIPRPYKGEYIEDWGTDDPKEQYWRKKNLPSFFRAVEYDKDGNAILNQLQAEYAREEVRRCKQGFYFLNNGKVTYITGKNYFYLQHWILEDDISPDYRDTDRRYFLFLNHWENTSWCLGVIRGKKRREGATSVGASNIVYESIFFKNSFCGLTSKTQIDAKAAFTNMISFGYRQLPVFLKPKQLNNKDSVTELVFAHKSVDIKGARGSVVDTDAGHRSKIDYRAPSLNSYDSGRLSRGLFDEGGKWSKETPFSKFISIVSKTLVKGAKRVGFLELPSTCNDMTSGGEEFKLVWDNADQTKYKKTPNRLVRYMSPAYDGYLGYIDKYGQSVIDPPTKEQYDYLVKTFIGAGDLSEEDVALGAKQYLLNKRQDLEGAALEEEIRMNPFDEREMFMLRNSNCHFDAVLLNQLYEQAKMQEKEVLEYGNWTWKDGVPFSEAVWETTSKEHARWTRPKGFKIPEGVKYEKRGELFFPKNNIQFISAVDPFQNNIVESGEGSKASSGILNRYDTEMGDDFYNMLFVSKYHARPPMAKLLHMDMILQCFAYGCQILVEAKMDGGMRDYFIDNNCEPFLIRIGDKANYGIDPNSDNKVLLVNVWEQYILTHGRAGKLIYPDVIDDKKDGLIKFDINFTEHSNQIMGMGWALVADYYKKANFKRLPKRNISDWFSKKKVA